MAETVSTLCAKIKEAIKTVIVGKDDVVDLLLISLLCGGHVLIEDVPGTGKTMLAKSLAASVACSFGRVQFTPDLLPSDVTGINFYNMKQAEFSFIPGPVFSNILLADEINRATPKTQSGLLECMEERQVTIDGETHPLPEPFMVIATENPLENMGVFPLPEAQLDRFLVKVRMQYPTHTENVEILRRFHHENPFDGLRPVATAEEIRAASAELSHVYLHDDMLSYCAEITETTRCAETVALGAGPRGALALMRVSQGYAALAGRDFVNPEDVRAAAVPVLAHRLLLKSSAKLQKDAAENTVRDLLSKVPVPTEAFTR